MLVSLTIKNYALIDSLEINFSNQFSVITGETGAGKSIILGALGMVLGNRADLNSLKNKDKKCIIEAHFSIENYNLTTFFTENDLDYEKTTIIRREILPSGKSRAFVNDSPVTLSLLQKLSNALVDIHSQHETRNIIAENYQLILLDTIAKNENLQQEYQQVRKKIQQVKKEHTSLVEEKEALDKEQEYNLFLLEELDKANLTTNQQQELENKLEELSHTEGIKEHLQKIITLVNEEEIGTLVQLKEIENSFQKLAGFSTNFTPLSERLSSLLIDLEDINDDCFSFSEIIIDNPELLEEVNQKLQLIYHLQNKHKVGSIEELLLIKENLSEKVAKVVHFEDTIKNLNTSIQQLTNTLNEIAKKLSDKRKKAALLFEEKALEILRLLGLPDAKITFNFLEQKTFTSTGTDKINLLFSANKGITLDSIKKAASGGELSRIMLATKAILANYSNLPTIIFDEIDTGVSGEIAVKIGEILQQMSTNMQVFAITHLPQIAAKGKQHYKVFKYNEGNNTISQLKLLTNKERILEIAEMLSGNNPSETALTHAKNLLN